MIHIKRVPQMPFYTEIIYASFEDFFFSDEALASFYFGLAVKFEQQLFA